MPRDPSFPYRLQEIRRRISEAAYRSKRRPEDVTLLAVSKSFSSEAVRDGYEFGLRDFGENRVQESLEKMKSLPPDVRWHLIGQLQTNKINKALGKFVLIHSVDSYRLGEALSSRGGDEVQDVLLEVNTSGEDTKSGVSPESAVMEAEKMSGLKGLKLKGLMTVGPLTDDLEKQRTAFKRLKEIHETIRGKDWAGNSFSILSMGMSNDFETAIEEGSTMVRIGTALFGQRG